MPESFPEKSLKGYEFSSIAFLFATLLCGIAALMAPSLLKWSVVLFLTLGALSSILGAYLLVRHAYEDPRFKAATLLVWLSGTVFVLAQLWIQYGMG